MHIALCGPATLEPFQQLFARPVETSGYPFPGTTALALYYAAQGHRVSVVTTAIDTKVAQHYASQQLDLHVVPSRARARERALDFFSVERRGIETVIDEIKPDVIHAHWTYEFGLAARASKVPSLVTVHDWAPAIARLNKHPYWYFRAAMQAKCLLAPGSISAPTRYIADKVQRLYRKQVSVIPNGIDQANFASLGEQLMNQVSQVRIGMLNVGFSRRKNVSTALQAWAYARKSCPDATLHLAGPGYEIDGEAANWARSRNLHQGVVFEGPIESRAVASWFVDKSIFLHTSLEESFGIVLVEAMASGVPVIAGKDAGAVAEITQKSAVLTDVRSVHAVSEALKVVIQDPALRLQLSQLGRETAARYDLESVGQSYLRELQVLPQ